MKVGSSQRGFIKSYPHEGARAGQRFTSLFELCHRTRFPVGQVDEDLLRFRANSFREGDYPATAVGNRMGSIFAMDVRVAQRLRGRAEGVEEATNTPRPFNASTVPVVGASRSVYFGEVSVRRTVAVRVSPYRQVIRG